MDANGQPWIHHINVEWFRDWNAPHPAVGHEDAWRRAGTREPSRAISQPTSGRRSGRSYAAVVFATPDAGVDPTEPLQTIIIRAVMASLHRTQPVVTIHDIAEPTSRGTFPGTDYGTVDGEPRRAPNDVTWLARADRAQTDDDW